MFVSEYLCSVKFIQKNIVFSIVLLLGMLLSYNAYFQYNNSSSSIKITVENNLTSNCFGSDSEILAEDQLTCATEFLSAVKKNTENNHFFFTSRLSRPFFAVWQPPKLS